ncbi:MAG: YdiU family protein [Roseofilum sp. SBFL]|uniref:protein adenylyltransferase SelO n=1 Tax=unclassified Roseofilum TaxID=2620099 RepID=UPI001AFE67A4|nr:MULTISPECIES: YdiU family protein [unclassified Roseofilum]MBP0012078.1 YdiU family protein [Roseofilum sp. SID3]MBP0023504.1 YdiU family protein [Roseofilum sp. SID2]MBP0037646.1 YdiU family protein [Roseofilum sp. SID1]MBP0044695.1 YdiU family protein [Roseofilum sp. SBFL]
MSDTVETNPFESLNTESALENLGDDYYDPVAAAQFPQHILRWRNNDLLVQMGLNPQQVSDRHFIDFFGKFESDHPCLALKYHGYQFGEYNPWLGDGRGFLYGQVRAVDGQLYDFGTKGSGMTPYSRGADGRLTLKGGVREILAGEMLHRLGVRTSRCLSLIETGESLWRSDEPSPARSCVMVRWSRSHIRFGTFERLRYFERSDLITKLLDHVIETYYPAPLPLVQPESARDRYIRFYDQLVQRVAQLAAQWMAAGFCHGVLNTDNMSITGESFDYGPYAFIPHYDPNFTAASFDYSGRYSYGNQPLICQLNLELLSVALAKAIPKTAMQESLEQFKVHYEPAYQQLMLRRLGLDRDQMEEKEAQELVELTLKLLKDTQNGYPQFFMGLRDRFDPIWSKHMDEIPNWSSAGPSSIWQAWKILYHRVLGRNGEEKLAEIGDRLQKANPQVDLLRPAIEAIWNPIMVDDNWQPFINFLEQL